LRDKPRFVATRYPVANYALLQVLKEIIGHMKKYPQLKLEDVAVTGSNGSDEVLYSPSLYPC
jgi:hypothetical protein